MRLLDQRPRSTQCLRHFSPLSLLLLPSFPPPAPLPRFNPRLSPSQTKHTSRTCRGVTRAFSPDTTRLRSAAGTSCIKTCAPPAIASSASTTASWSASAWTRKLQRRRLPRLMSLMAPTMSGKCLSAPGSFRTPSPRLMRTVSCFLLRFLFRSGAPAPPPKKRKPLSPPPTPPTHTHSFLFPRPQSFLDSLPSHTHL